jgi:hypothetical protein
LLEGIQVFCAIQNQHQRFARRFIWSFERLKERALEYAWMLGILGNTQVKN